MAETRLKRSIVLDKVAELEQIEVSEDEVKSELDRINESARASEMQPLQDNETNRESIRDDMRGRRTLDRAVRIARGLPDEE